MSTKHFQVLVIGGGTGGISVAARLRAKLGSGKVGILEPSTEHYYQPLWTLVGAGVIKKEKTLRKMADLIPIGVEWIRDTVNEVRPLQNSVITASGQMISYDALVVAAGLKLDFGRIKGATEALGKNGVCSIYQYQDAEKTAELLQGFRGGNAIFTMPPVPIKCAGAPQKIMYLADEIFRKNGVREKSKVTFTVAGKVIFGVPAFAKPLNEVVKKKDIQALYSHKLIEILAEDRFAVFEKTVEQTVNGEVQAVVEIVRLPYDVLHVVPPMSAPAFIQASQLAFTSGPHTGWLKVDQATLQHQDYANIFGIGDITGVPNSKTGAAIRKQAPVVTENLIAFLEGQSTLPAKYDGYSSCPLITGFGKVILAEFGYDGKLLPTFPMDMTKERRSMWYLKKDLLPPIYWKGMLKGRL